MTVREYIGARYVPLYMGVWNNTVAYEPLSVVTYQGNSYTSRQAVPVGIAITNETYWIQSANYSAQVEAYRQEVQTFDGRIDALEANGSVTSNKIANGAVTQSKIADDTISFDKLVPSLQNRITALEADGSVTNSKLANEAVTQSKIADDTISFDKLVPSLQNTITEIANNINYMVVIGDSFSYSAGGYTETPYWWEYAQRRIGVTVKNYAQGGCGYTTGSKTFLQQANEAVADTSFNHKFVKYVVVYGGVNDHGAYTTSLVNNVLQTLANEFTNAKILFAFNAGRARTDSNSARQNIFNWLSQSGIPHCSTFPVENISGAISTTDSLHPTDIGSALIGNLIISALGCGDYTHTGVAWDFPITVNNNAFSVTSRRGIINGDKLTLYLRIQQTGDSTNYQTCRISIPTIIGTEYNGVWYRQVANKVASIDGHANVSCDGSYLIAQNNDNLTIDLNPSTINPNNTQYNLKIETRLY